MKKTICLLALTATMCASAPPRESIPTVDQLTLDEKIGQLFVHASHGYFTNESGWRYRDLLRHVRDHKVGGVIWFVSSVHDTAFLTARLQREARVPLLVSADVERGVGMRFENTTTWPSAMATAATGEPRFAEDLGRITAREVRAIGVNHILAPVADVNIDPDNPVINTRSFGEDPHDVARYVTAFIRGVQSEGLLATAKHFPGHGDTHVDSHRSLPTLPIDRQRLDAVELVPFRAAIEAGVASVMVGHLSIPLLDDTPVPVRSEEEARRENVYAPTEGEIARDGTIPASLSPIIVDGLLRRELGFDGLVVTDALDMGALVSHYDVAEAAVRAIEAGNDQIIKSPDTGAAIAGVKAAVASGRLTEARIDESVRRILDAKRRVRAHVGSVEEIFRVVDSEEHRAKAQEIARRAVTLLREGTAVLPLASDARVVTLVVSDTGEPATMLHGMQREVAGRLTQRPVSFFLDQRSRPGEKEAVLDAARSADVVLLALSIRARSGAGEIALPQVARDVIRELPPNVIAVSFGSPYLVREIPNVATYLCAYGIQPVMQRAVVEALFGEIGISGKLPVTIPGMFRRGEGIQRAATTPSEETQQ